MESEAKVFPIKYLVDSLTKPTYNLLKQFYTLKDIEYISDLEKELKNILEAFFECQGTKFVKAHLNKELFFTNKNILKSMKNKKFASKAQFQCGELNFKDLARIYSNRRLITSDDEFLDFFKGNSLGKEVEEMSKRIRHQNVSEEFLKTLLSSPTKEEGDYVVQQFQQELENHFNTLKET